MRIVIEALEESSLIQKIILSEPLINSQSARSAVITAEKMGIPILKVSENVFKVLSNREGPQGLAAVLKMDFKELSNFQKNLEGIWIALYQVADPGNLGTILRTLDGMGGAGMILIDHCTDPYDPTSIRASMGSIFNKTILKSSSEYFEKWVKITNTVVIGTSDSAKKDYLDYSYPNDLILLMGSEREGIPVKMKENCHNIISIPMLGKSDSLNLAVASSVILYEIFNQRRKQKEKR
ncbi:MAG: RNA methyltransferase [Chloroflexi bacterium]|nr:RNA methyltransferase [Chloroflexota bacterium]